MFWDCISAAGIRMILRKIDGIMNKKMHSDFDPLCNNTSRKLLTGFIFSPDNESTHTVMAVKAYLDPRPFAVCPPLFSLPTFLSSLLHYPIKEKVPNKFS